MFWEFEHSKSLNASSVKIPPDQLSAEARVPLVDAVHPSEPSETNFEPERGFGVIRIVVDQPLRIDGQCAQRVGQICEPLNFVRPQVPGGLKFWEPIRLLKNIPGDLAVDLG